MDVAGDKTKGKRHHSEVSTSSADISTISNMEDNDINTEGDLTKFLVASIASLHRKFDTAIENVTQVNQEVNNPETGLKTKVVHVLCETEELRDDVKELQDDMKKMKEQIKLMTAIVQKKDQEITSLRAAVTDQTRRQMRDNILITGLPEHDGENLVGKVKSLLEDIEIDHEHGNTGPISFDRIHRFGTASVKHHRPIVAKVHDYKDKEKILKNAPKLKLLQKDAEGKSTGLYIYINEQFPDEIQERRRENFAKMKANYQLEEQDRAKMKLVSYDKLMINGELDRPIMLRPSITSVMNPDKDELEKMEKIKGVVGERVCDKGNSFTGIAVQAKSLNDARRAYKKVIRMPEYANAAHVMSAFTYTRGEKSVSGHYDDGEHGGGQSIERTLSIQKTEDTVVFVVRHHPNKDYHLGPKRFNLIQEAAKSAVEKLQQRLA